MALMLQPWKGSLGLPFVAWAGLPALALLAVGCADLTGDGLHQDVAQLRQEVNALTLAVHRARGDAEAVTGQIDRRTREEAAESKRQLGALSGRLDALGTEVAGAAARLEEISQRLESLSRQLAARPAAPPTPAVPQLAAPAAVPGPRVSGGEPTAEQAYQAAYLDFTKGNFPLALSGFREFVRRFPDSPLADKAQYWVGESYFSLARASAGAGQKEKAARELQQAVQEFRKVVLNYPRGEKVPTAIYKEALALIELRQPRVARLRLQYLLENFPQSEEAPLARERLAALSG
ncbi:MAG: tetratricopeptide repeat protein [Candidatus Rokubacteria bacterium]|nr:tetratricopeptide repeat protein [Candidatus Rokubacteria bacterium]